jgi:hypothetical protein
MQDLRELVDLKDWWYVNARRWQDIPFSWKQWDRPSENWTHDHCEYCQACICDHRERFPEWKSAHEERGCYRHAYFAELEKGKYIWVCRNCFKRIQSEFGWTVVGAAPDG